MHRCTVVNSCTTQLHNKYKYPRYHCTMFKFVSNILLNTRLPFDFSAGKNSCFQTPCVCVCVVCWNSFCCSTFFFALFGLIVSVFFFVCVHRRLDLHSGNDYRHEYRIDVRFFSELIFTFVAWSVLDPWKNTFGSLSQNWLGSLSFKSVSNESFELIKFQANATSCIIYFKTMR